MSLVSHLSRHDIRTRALRAAAKVALLGAGVGCGTAETTTLAAQAANDAGVEPNVQEGAADATAMVDSGTVVVTDAGIATDAGLGVMDAGAELDAGGEVCDPATQSNEDYLACCERIGWDWDRGCAAWGPAAPPSMKRGELA